MTAPAETPAEPSRRHLQAVPSIGKRSEPQGGPIARAGDVLGNPALRHLTGGVRQPVADIDLAADTVVVPGLPTRYRVEDAEAAHQRRLTQLANRRAVYVNRRASKYANVTYDTLDPDQDPGRRVSTWWSSPRQPRGLFLGGLTRRGKSTAAYAICNEAHAADKWVMAWYAGDLHDALKVGGDENAFDHAVNCDLLLIDDLGSEKPSDFWLTELQRIAEARCTNDRRIIVTANVPADIDKAYNDLVARYGDPIIERLLDGAGMVVLDGPQRRNLITDW